MGLSRREAWVALVSAALALSTVMALAAHGDGPPRLIPYQASLEHNGQPVEGAVSLDLRLFNAPMGGTLLWAEALADVPVQAGRLGVVLGETAPLPASVFEEEHLWLEVAVDGTTLASRQRILPAPQAVASRQASRFEVTHDLYWSSDGWLRDDQGGVIELGGGQGTTPYIDFHAGGPNADYSTRLMADPSGLRVQGGGGPSGGNGLVVDGQVQAGSGAVAGSLAAGSLSAASLAVTGVATVGSLNAGATKLCSAIRPDDWRTDLPVPNSWTPEDCANFAYVVGAGTHTLGCIFRVPTGNPGSRFRLGAGGNAVPNPNCGW